MAGIRLTLMISFDLFSMVIFPKDGILEQSLRAGFKTLRLRRTSAPYEGMRTNERTSSKHHFKPPPDRENDKNQPLHYHFISASFSLRFFAKVYFSEEVESGFKLISQ